MEVMISDFSIDFEVLIRLHFRDVGRENLCLRAQVRLKKQKLKTSQNTSQHELGYHH